MELRYIDAEVRVSGTAEVPIIEGYGIVFNSMSLPIGGRFREIVKPGAIKNLAGGDVRGRYNHELILGRTRSGTMKLAEDAKGIRYEITPANSDSARHVVESVRRGDVNGSSFMFNVNPGGDSWRKENGEVIRELTSITIGDIGPVDDPAYPATTAGIRSANDKAQQEYIEKKLAELEATPNRDSLGKRLGY